MRFVILGMHKSGTTLVAKMLHHSGINMVEDVSRLDYDQGNKYERTEIVFTNLAILDIPFSLKSYKSSNHKTSQPKHEAFIVNDHVSHIVTKLDNCHTNWGFKDPRTCLTYSFWKNILGEHKIIGVFRSPWSVLTHYTSKYKLGQYRIDIIYKVLKSWYIHNQVIFENTLDTNAVLIDYHTLMTDKGYVAKLSNQLDIELVDLRNVKLNRSMAKANFLGFLVCKFLKYFYSFDVKSLHQKLNTRATL